MGKQRRELVTLCLSNPCTASWEEMTGDDTVRFCRDCQLNVHNLSAMTAGEAESFLNLQDSRICVGFVRKADGTILTQDRPARKPYKPLKIRSHAGVVVAASLLTLLVLVTVVFTADMDLWTSLRRIRPIETVLNWLVPPAAPSAPTVPPPTFMGKL